MPNRTGYAKINVLVNHYWIHDKTGETFRQKMNISKKSTKPDFINSWFDGNISGDTVQFTDDEGNQHSMTLDCGLRGINIDAVVVFDLDSQVLVFY